MNKIQSMPLKTLEYTNKILPQNQDKTWKIVAKFVLIIATLGTIFAFTLTIDLLKNAYKSVTAKKLEPPKPATIIQRTIYTIEGIFHGIVTSLAVTTLFPAVAVIIYHKNKYSIHKWTAIPAYLAITSIFLSRIFPNNSAPLIGALLVSSLVSYIAYPKFKQWEKQQKQLKHAD